MLIQAAYLFNFSNISVFRLCRLMLKYFVHGVISDRNRDKYGLRVLV